MNVIGLSNIIDGHSDQITFIARDEIDSTTVISK